MNTQKKKKNKFIIPTVCIICMIIIVVTLYIMNNTLYKSLDLTYGNVSKYTITSGSTGNVYDITNEEINNIIEKLNDTKVKEKDFQVFYLYDLVSNVILDYYPTLKDAILEFKETIYVKLLKRLVQNKQDEFDKEKDYIIRQLKRTCFDALKSNIRSVTKIRVLVGSLSTRMFWLLCIIENKLGAKS